MRDPKKRDARRISPGELEKTRAGQRKRMAEARAKIAVFMPNRHKKILARRLRPVLASVVELFRGGEAIKAYQLYNPVVVKMATDFAARKIGAASGDTRGKIGWLVGHISERTAGKGRLVITVLDEQALAKIITGQGQARKFFGSFAKNYLEIREAAMDIFSAEMRKKN